MTPADALRLALTKEEAAIEFYRKLSLEHPAIKNLLISLLSEEEKHKKIISEKLAAMEG